MRKHTQIRLERLRQCCFAYRSGAILRDPQFQLSEYSAPRLRPEKPVVRQSDITEEINSSMAGPNRYFLRVQPDFQVLAQEVLDRIDEINQNFFAAGNDHEIIRIPGITFHPQSLFDELIELVHVNIGKELGGKIADRQALAVEQGRPSGRKASDDSFRQPHGIRVGYFPAEHRQKHLMIDRVKKFLHVALERKAWSRKISAFFPDHLLERQNAFMVSFAYAARKRIRDKRRVKDRIQDAEHCVVQNPVADGGFMDMTNFRIPDVKVGIGPVGIPL